VLQVARFAAEDSIVNLSDCFLPILVFEASGGPKRKLLKLPFRMQWMQHGNYLFGETANNLARILTNPLAIEKPSM
jgi:hypothetical protein